MNFPYLSNYSPGRGGVANEYYPGGGGGVFVRPIQGSPIEPEPACDCIHGGEGFGGGGGNRCAPKNGAIVLDFCYAPDRCYTENG